MAERETPTKEELHERLARTKDELLSELEGYPEDEVDGVIGRVSAAIGYPNAEGFDTAAHVLGVVSDVLRGRARHELRALGERLANTYEQLWLADEDTILAVSPAAAASLGYTPEELTGRSGEQLRPDGQDWGPARAALYEHGELEDVLLVRHRDGTTVPLSFQARIVTIGGRRLRFGRTRVLARSRGGGLARARAYFEPVAA